MDITQYLKNLRSPAGAVDVILDTDTFNEVDDQYAISYMLRSGDRLNVKGICAAPFFNSLVDSPAEGMLKSIEEIHTLLKLAGRQEICSCVYKGSTDYLTDEKTPHISDAAKFMASASDGYSPEKPLYIVAIGAITNVASALLLNPAMRENTVIVWLGGHAHHLPATDEFNMRQDYAAARVIFGCGVPLVQLPCHGVVDRFTVSKPELEYWLCGKNPLADHLAAYTIKTADSYANGKPWTRVIWDVTAIAWLLNDNNRFMTDELRSSPIPEYDGHYAFDSTRHFIRYVTSINRDALFEDLFRKLT